MENKRGSLEIMWDLTELCNKYEGDNNKFPFALVEYIEEQIFTTEQKMKTTIIELKDQIENLTQLNHNYKHEIYDYMYSVEQLSDKIRFLEGELQKFQLEENKIIRENRELHKKLETIHTLSE